MFINTIQHAMLNIIKIKELDYPKYNSAYYYIGNIIFIPN